MNTITRWNPFKEMEDLTNRLTSFWGVSPMRRPTEEYMTEAEWAPLVDIIEDETEYLIKADLPELNKKDISVRVENGVLYIAGERKLEKATDGKRYHRTERMHGSFVRSFTLPEEANPEEITAEFKDGVLTVRLIKRESAKTKLIDVKVS
ncbi:MAG: Hsp20/alpha crystallin family protein [Verrucomicrobia bacterium]|nr:Hsp20/alpha crystallin family protein [Verrucomicrobiota bacterium]